MYLYKPQNQEVRKHSNLLKTAAYIALGISVAVGTYCVSHPSKNNLEKVIFEKAKEKHLNFDRMRVEVPKEYVSAYQKIQKAGAFPYECDMVASTGYAETNHQQLDKYGNCIIADDGDTGIMQLTPPAVEETLNMLLNPRYKNQSPEAKHAYKVSSNLLKPYLNAFGKELYSSKSRKKVVKKIMKKIAEDSYANLFFGTAYLLNRRAFIKQECRKHRVTYVVEMTDAAYKNPEEMKKALDFKSAWKSHLSPSTQRHGIRFDRYYRS